MDCSTQIVHRFKSFTETSIRHQKKFSQTKMPLNSISEDDEIFLKEFLRDFYRQVIKIRNYVNFEKILTEWIKEFFDHNKKDSKIILKLMEDHEESESWFSSLIGFFYEHGIGVIIDKNKSLELYSSINNERNKKLVSVYQMLNIIITKYLLSFYYYKDIILNMIVKNENGMSISQNQFENFNGLGVNMCKDEINTIEIYVLVIREAKDIITYHGRAVITTLIVK